jgi:hypothetical protein
MHADGFCVQWTAPVGAYPEAPETSGFFDLAGNVWEWVNDWVVCYLGTDPVSDPPGPATGTDKVLRGGSWSWDEEFMRCAVRFYAPPEETHLNRGFRTARTVHAGADAGDGSSRAVLRLLGNEPNPFSMGTRIGYTLPRRARISLMIHTPAGRLIRTLASGNQPAGLHFAGWDGRSNSGERVAPGVYFYNLRADGISLTGRMILIR